MVKQKIKNETKEEKFKRIATKRVNKVLDNLRLLSNCSNRAIYSYTDKQVNQIFSAIEQDVKHIKPKFIHKKRRIIL